MIYNSVSMPIYLPLTIQKQRIAECKSVKLKARYPKSDILTMNNIGYTRPFNENGLCMQRLNQHIQLILLSIIAVK